MNLVPPKCLPMCSSDCRYLERRLDTADRIRFYFFNSFFFTKLLGNTSASNDIDQCKVDYEQVRKWSGEVNLFEKDYIFIPVVRRCDL
jgi:sentrin-specific protease 7